MSVANIPPYVTYVANGTTASFAIPFDYAYDSDVNITIDGVAPDVGVVSLVDNNMVFTKAPVSGTVIYIYRETPQVRETDYDNHDNVFRPRVVNKDFDRIWYVIQEFFKGNLDLWDALKKEIQDRKDGDDLILDGLAQEIQDRIKGDDDLKKFIISMIDEAIEHGLASAVAVTHVASIDELNELENKWDTRTVYVKDIGMYQYNGSTEAWESLSLNSNGWTSRADGYPLNARLQLTNGDIVRSTVANNKVNPNVDMTGWSNFESDQQVINEAVKAYQYANYKYDARSFGITPDKTTNWTTQILAALATLPESSTFYIPQGALWLATSDPTSVYNAMPDNCVIIDDSGYESRYVYSDNSQRWQSSQQIYYKTKDYGSAGRRNGNTFNIRGDYNVGYVIEMDGAFGTSSCKGTILFRMNNGTQDGIQIAGDGTDSTKAHLAFATYGLNVSNGATAFKMGLQSSISPHSFNFNSDLVGGVDFIFGKGQKLSTDSGGTAWMARPHVIRTTQPSGHTGTFTHLWYKGSAIQHREDLSDAGDRTFTPKTTGQGTMVYTNLNELGGFKKRVITGSIGSTVSIAYSNGYCSNYGAGGAQNVTLPVPTKGLAFEFGVDAAQNLRIIPNSGASFIGKSAGKYMESITIGSRLRVIALDSTTWSFERSGTWVDET